MIKGIFFIFSFSFLIIFRVSAGMPDSCRLSTPWTETVTSTNAWQLYPRPQLKRPGWYNLNGIWKYAITDQNSGITSVRFNDEILVPFPIESYLSRVQRTFLPTEKLWYEREFEIGTEDKGKDILLHFGAVDYACEVWVNDKLVGSHVGGFTPFSFNITRFLTSNGTQKIVLGVIDPTDTESIIRGKQKLNPQRIWYTPVSGIWQTVWLEAVNSTYINRILPTSDIDNSSVQLELDFVNQKGNEHLKIMILDDEKIIATENRSISSKINIQLSNPVLWSPVTPKLYTIQVELYRGKQLIDKVESYFAMRKVAMGKDELGYSRIFLNNQPVFQLATLDQGWWPDGLLTPPTPEAMKWDMIQLKEMGFNTVRKHLKIEPALYYYYADSLGLMIWQDMPSGFASSREKEEKIGHLDPHDWNAPEPIALQWRSEFKEMIDNYRFFPSITTWVIFNEGWGQHNTVDNVKWAEEIDRTRIINGVSGWTDRIAGDMFDIHNYPFTSMIKSQFTDDRISVLGEFGGLGLAVDGHVWNPNLHNWGYRNINNSIDLISDYSLLMYDLETLIPQGLAAAVYTQTTDVESEVNGLITYDRKVIKLPATMLNVLHSRLYNLKPAIVDELIPDGQSGLKNNRTVTLNGITEKVLLPYVNKKTGVISSKDYFQIERKYKSLSLWLDVNGQVKILLNGTKIFDRNVRSTRQYNQFNLSNFTYLLHSGQNYIEIVVDQKVSSARFDYGLTAY